MAGRAVGISGGYDGGQGYYQGRKDIDDAFHFCPSCRIFRLEPAPKGKYPLQGRLQPVLFFGDVKERGYRQIGQSKFDFMPGKRKTLQGGSVVFQILWGIVPYRSSAKIVMTAARHIIYDGDMDISPVEQQVEQRPKLEKHFLTRIEEMAEVDSEARILDCVKWTTEVGYVIENMSVENWKQYFSACRLCILVKNGADHRWFEIMRPGDSEETWLVWDDTGQYYERHQDLLSREELPPAFPSLDDKGIERIDITPGNRRSWDD